MSEGADENVDHIQVKLNKILETRYDTDKVKKSFAFQRHHFTHDFAITGRH